MNSAQPIVKPCDGGGWTYLYDAVWTTCRVLTALFQGEQRPLRIGLTKLIVVVWWSLRLESRVSISHRGLSQCSRFGWRPPSRHKFSWVSIYTDIKGRTRPFMLLFFRALTAHSELVEWLPPIGKSSLTTFRPSFSTWLYDSRSYGLCVWPPF